MRLGWTRRFLLYSTTCELVYEVSITHNGVGKKGTMCLVLWVSFSFGFCNNNNSNNSNNTTVTVNIRIILHVVPCHPTRDGLLYDVLGRRRRRGWWRRSLLPPCISLHLHSDWLATRDYRGLCDIVFSIFFSSSFSASSSFFRSLFSSSFPWVFFLFLPIFFSTFLVVSSLEWLSSSVYAGRDFVHLLSLFCVGLVLLRLCSFLFFFG